MFRTLVLESVIDEQGNTAHIVRDNIPEKDPLFPDIPIEERFSEDFLKDTVKTEAGIPTGWRYDPETKKFSAPPEPDPSLEFATAASWRELQYRTRLMIELGKSLIAVDKAVLLRYSYISEWEAEHGTIPIPEEHIIHELAVAIKNAKDQIREESKKLFPGEEFDEMGTTTLMGVEVFTTRHNIEGR